MKIRIQFKDPDAVTDAIDNAYNALPCPDGVTKEEWMEIKQVRRNRQSDGTGARPRCRACQGQRPHGDGQARAARLRFASLRADLSKATAMVQHNLEAAQRAEALLAEAVDLIKDCECHRYGTLDKMTSFLAKVVKP